MNEMNNDNKNAKWYFLSALILIVFDQVTKQMPKYLIKKNQKRFQNSFTLLSIPICKLTHNGSRLCFVAENTKLTLN